MQKSIFFFFISFISFFECSNQVSHQKEIIAVPENNFTAESDRLKGLSVVAPPSAFQTDPMIEIKKVNANWIAVIPYGFCRVGEKQVFFNMDRQWWGERAEGVKETIRLAKASNIKVMLKPQVWVPGSWTGGITFEKDEDWEEWEKSYESYIMFYIDLIQEMEVDMVCVGTEFKQSEVRREKFWRTLISKIKEKYKGKLTYAANWDSYNFLPFWDDLDYIGVDAYFPLDESKQPKKDVLMKQWDAYDQELSKVHKKFKKPIIFTEYGYMTIDGCAGKTWELEPKSHLLPTNEKAQADAIEALLDYFEDKSYWKGGFLWKWYPYPGHYQERGDKDYTPQGKLSEKVLTEWYKKL